MSRLLYTPKNINNTPANPFVIQNLTVNNSATIGGTLSAGATSVSSFSSGSPALFNTISAAGTLSVSGTSTLGVVNSGNHAVTGTLSSSALATLFGLSVTNSALIGGSLTVNTNASVAGTLGVTGISTLDVTNTGNLAATGTLSSSGLATLNSLSVTNNATITGTGTASTLYETQAVTNVSQSAYVVLPTDRLILLTSTGAGGPFAITFPVATQRIRVSIVMVAFNTATFTASVLGTTVIWENAGDAATFVNAGGGTWYLESKNLSLTV